MGRVVEDFRLFYEELEARAYSVATARHGREKIGRRRRMVGQVSPWLLMLVEVTRDLRFLMDAYRRREFDLDDEALADLEQWRKSLPEKLRQFRSR
jgi:hypothetical protein